MNVANEKRLIDADALMAYFEEQWNLAMDDPDPVSGYVMAALRCCMEYFKTIPIVDAVEAVRCKDCKHYRESEHPERTGIKFCYRLKGRDGKHIGYNSSDNDFCSYGERRMLNESSR